MGIRRFIRLKLIDKLPPRYRLPIERWYCWGMKKEITLYKQLCDPQKTSLDIGANKGIITLFLIKYSSYVYSFEPIPYLCEDLRHRFSGCNVSIEECALGDTNNNLLLNIPRIGDKKYMGHSSLLKNFKNDYIFGEKVTDIEKLMVNVRKLDNFNIDNIGFMKIDVEGFELNVLQGANDTIKKYMPNMLIEIEQRHHKQRKISDIFQYIKNIGYFGYFIFGDEIREIEEFDVKQMQIQANESGHDYIHNFIFSPMPISSLKI